MHTLLEAYLEQVAAHLSALPLKRRTEELREIRQHLMNAVTVNRELGQTEDEAAQNTIMQFGAAEDLGSNLVWAWRRGMARDRHSFWGAAVCTPIMLVLMPVLLLSFVITPLEHTISPHWKILEAGYNLFGIACIVAAGAINGTFFPKRAIAGTTLAAVIYSGFCVAGHCHTPNAVPYSLVTRMVIEYAAQSVQVGLVALFFAWTSRRWKQKRQRA